MKQSAGPSRGTSPDQRGAAARFLFLTLVPSLEDARALRLPIHF